MNFGSTASKVGTVQPFSFGTSGLNAPVNPTTTTSSMSILGLNLSVAKPLANTSAGFSFGGAGTAPTTVTSKLPSFGGCGLFGSQGTPAFGTTSSTTASIPGFGLNLASSSLTTFPTTSSISTTSSHGLGGVHLSTASSNVNASSGTLGGGGGSGNFATMSASCGDSKHGKDVALPEEVVRTVDTFKKFLAEQKQMRDTLIKHSEAPLLRTREELASVRRMIVQFEGELRRRVGLTRTLRQDLSRHERHICGLRRHAETPFVAADACLGSSTGENLQFFAEYVNEAENRLFNYRQELESLEALLSGTQQFNNECNPTDLAALFRRVHEGFVSVAAQLSLVHEAMDLRRSSLRRKPGHPSQLPLKSVNARANARCLRAMDCNFYGPSPFESAAVGFGVGPVKNSSGAFGASGLATGYPASGGISNNLANGSTLLGGNIAPPSQGLSGSFAGFGASASNNLSFGSTFSSPAGGTLFGGAAASPAAGSFFNKTSTGARPPSAPGTTFGSENASSFGTFGTTAGSGFQLQTPPSGKKKR